jgi:drug/metabolite transporter (DMT)-like permease
MLGIVLGLASSLAWGTSDFLGGLQSRRISALSVLLVSQPVGLALALVAAVVSGGDALSGREMAIAFGSGAAAVLALAAFYRAMAVGSISVVATIGALGIAVPVLAGIIGGEEPGALQAIGAVAAFTGAVLVAREPNRLRAPSAPVDAAVGAKAPQRTDPDGRHGTTASVGLAALAGLGFGLFFWGLDLSSPPNPAWTIVAARVGSVMTLLVAWAIVRPPMPSDRSMLPALVLIGFCDVAANSLFALATNHGLLSLVSVAGAMYSAVTVLLARFILGERLAGVQRAGVVLALAGVAALAGGSG